VEESPKGTMEATGADVEELDGQEETPTAPTHVDVDLEVRSNKDVLTRQTLQIERTLDGGRTLMARINLIAKYGVWKTNPSTDILHTTYIPPQAITQIRVKGSVNPIEIGMVIENEGV
jgi:hypothetical protein